MLFMLGCRLKITRQGSETHLANVSISHELGARRKIPSKWVQFSSYWSRDYGYARTHLPPEPFSTKWKPILKFMTEITFWIICDVLPKIPWELLGKFTPTFRVVRREHQSGHPNCRFATQVLASNPEVATINFQQHRWSRYISLLSYKLGWVAVFSANSPAYAGQGWEITRLSSFVHG